MKEKTNQRDSQGRAHGLWENYYPNDTLWWRARFHYGKPHGLWERYLEDGTLSLKYYRLTIK